MLEWRLECIKKLYGHLSVLQLSLVVAHVSVHTTNFSIPHVNRLCSTEFPFDPPTQSVTTYGVVLSSVEL